MQLNHEKLDVYQASIEFLGFSFQIIPTLPKGFAFLSDQLKRASLSIPLNIAEGTGKFDIRDKSKYFKIARGSATECAAILDAIVTIELLDKTELERGKLLLYRIVCMLSKLL